MRLAIVSTHPIQYQAPWFRELACTMDIEVLYGHRQDATGQSESGFGVPFEWDAPLLEGYPFRWLRNVARRPGLETFSGCDTPELYEMLRPDRFAACLILGWNHKCYVQAAAACWRNNVPLMVRGDSQLLTSRSRLRRLVKSVPYRFLLPRCAAHLYVGARNRDYLRHYDVPDARLFFCPHAVNNTFFASRAEHARRDGTNLALRRQFGIDVDDCVALFVGKLIDKKRAADFIAVCARVDVMPSGRKLHGILVGDGQLRRHLTDVARPWAERIHFAGFRNQSELPAWYAAAGALLLCSDASETWGLVVNEAMACGVPVVASDAAGCVPDLIEPGRTGYSYPVGDVEAMAARLCELDSAFLREPSKFRLSLAEKMSVYSFDRATEGLRAALERIERDGVPRPSSDVAAAEPMRTRR